MQTIKISKFLIFLRQNCCENCYLTAEFAGFTELADAEAVTADTESKKTKRIFNRVPNKNVKPHAAAF